MYKVIYKTKGDDTLKSVAAYGWIDFISKVENEPNYEIFEVVDDWGVLIPIYDFRVYSDGNYCQYKCPHLEWDQEYDVLICKGDVSKCAYAKKLIFAAFPKAGS